MKAKVSTGLKYLFGVVSFFLLVSLHAEAKEETEIVLQTGHTSWVCSVAFSPDEKYIVSGSYDKTVRLWDSNTGKELRKFKGHIGSVSSAAFSPDGKSIVSGSDDGSLKIWTSSTGKIMVTMIGFRDNEWVV